MQLALEYAAANKLPVQAMSYQNIDWWLVGKNSVDQIYLGLAAGKIHKMIINQLASPTDDYKITIVPVIDLDSEYIGHY